MTEIIKPFRIRLKEALEHREMRAVDLCKKTRISQSTMSQYISGYAEPKKERLNLIATALNVNPTWLMGLDVPMERTFRDVPNNSSLNSFDNVEDFKKSYNKSKFRNDKLISSIIDNVEKLNIDGKKNLLDYSYFLLNKTEYALSVNAANAIPNASAEDKEYDDDIMNDENF